MLSRDEILACIKSGDLGFNPEVPPESIDQVSIDLRLGDRFSRFKREAAPHISSINIRSPDAFRELAGLWETFTANEATIAPGQFLLAVTLESVTIPTHLAAFVEGKSSYARIGLTIHQTAPKIDPGYCGHIALELGNIGPMAINLQKGERICQLVFFRLGSPVSNGEQYGSRPADIFQHQERPLPGDK